MEVNVRYRAADGLNVAAHIFDQSLIVLCQSTSQLEHLVVAVSLKYVSLIKRVSVIRGLYRRTLSRRLPFGTQEATKSTRPIVRSQPCELSPSSLILSLCSEIGRKVLTGNPNRRRVHFQTLSYYRTVFTSLRTNTPSFQTTAARTAT